MSPLDDELRRSIATRTSELSPSPDLLAVVERRAGRIRRRRVAAAVAGSALAVSAVGLGGPLLVSSLTSTTPAPSVVATAEPTPTAEPVPSGPASLFERLDLHRGHLWPFRGDPAAREDMADASAVQWAAARGADPADVELVPLWAEVFEPSQVATLVFLARVGDGPWHWAVASSSEAGPAVWRDEPLRPRTYGLAVALPGDEVSRLLVLSDPLAVPSYGPGDGTFLEGDDGLLLVPREGDPDRDVFRVTADETLLTEQRAPEPPARDSPPETPSDPPPGDEVPPPAGLVDWPVRGSASPELVEEALTAFARDAGTTRELVKGRLLYGSERDGRNLVLLAAWQQGRDAQTYLYIEAAGNGSGFVASPAPRPAVLAFLVPAQTVFADADWLLVVPEPRAGQVLYSADGTSEPEPVASQGTEVAVVIDRRPGAQGDRVLVLDGDGDFDRPLYRGTVAELLAAQ